MKRTIGTLGIFIIFSTVILAFPAFPIQIYGELENKVPDGTKIDFRIDDKSIGESVIIDNRFGYMPVILLPQDDPATPEKEGYAAKDTITIYVEDIKVKDIKEMNVNPFRLVIEQNKNIAAAFAEKNPTVASPTQIGDTNVMMVLLVLILVIGFTMIHFEKKRK